jgi:DNA mismatch repair ATPase MutS
MIDAASVANLELVSNLKTGTKKDTLMSIVNHTQTPGGSKLLHSILLQPLTGKILAYYTNMIDLATINTRLDCVEELLHSEKKFFQVNKCLSGFSFDVDHLLTQFIHCNKSATVRTAQTLITSLICLKKVIEQAPVLGEAVSKYDNDIFRAIAANLTNSDLATLIDEIDTILVEDVNYCKLNS